MLSTGYSLAKGIGVISYYAFVARYFRSLARALCDERPAVEATPLPNGWKGKFARFWESGARNLGLVAEALDADAQEFINNVLRKARDQADRFMIELREDEKFWIADPPFPRADFEQTLAAWRTWEMPQELNAPTTQNALNDDPAAREFSSFLIEWFFGKYRAEDAWDHIYRFRSVMTFLSDHRKSLRAAPLDIMHLCDCQTRRRHVHINPTFLDFILGGFETRDHAGEPPRHVLMDRYGNFEVRKTINAFREWLAEHGDTNQDQRTEQAVKGDSEPVNSNA